MKRRVLVWKQLRQWSHWGVVACFVTMARWDSDDSGVLWHVLSPWQDETMKTGVLWHVLSPWQDETVKTLGCCGMFCHHGKMKQWRLGCCGMFCHHGKMRQWWLWCVVACFVTMARWNSEDWGVVACFVTMARWDSEDSGVLWHVLSRHSKMTEHVKFGALHACFAISAWFAITWGQNMPKPWLWWHFSFWGERWGQGGGGGRLFHYWRL